MYEESKDVWQRNSGDDFEKRDCFGMKPEPCPSASQGPSSLGDWVFQQHVVNAIHHVRLIANTSGLLFHNGPLRFRVLAIQHVLDLAEDCRIPSTVKPSIHTCSFGHQGLTLVLGGP